MLQRVFVVLLALCVLGAPALYGQASAGMASISGVVNDQSGSVMPAVEVTVRNVGTNALRTLSTNEAGRYEAVALQPGEYEVSASRAGFSTLVRKGINLSVGQKAVVDLTLNVSATVETVTVTGDSASVETDKTEVSTVINTKDMMNLPLNGRRWDAFVITTPGASNDGSFGLITFRGLSGLYNNNMIDGMDNNQAFFSEAKGRTRLSYGISSEAVQEFQVGTSNFSAQYGRAAGGVVNAVTKSGANDMHGTFFYLIRDDSLNAENSLSKAAGVAKPKDRRQQFGPSVGGAIKKDSLFYFLSYDQQKRSFPAVIIPGAQSFLSSTGSAPGLANAIAFYRGLQGPQDRQGNQNLGLAKIDWNVTSRNQISETINILRWDSPNGVQTAPTHPNHLSANGSDVVKNETYITRWNSVIRPTFVSEVRFQYGRDFEAQVPNAGGPSVSVTNGINFGMPDFLPRSAYPDERRFQVSQNLSWLRGRHSLKFGYDLNWVRDKMIQLFQGGGVYSYSTLNDIALDCVSLKLPLGGCEATPTTGAAGLTGRHYTSFSQGFDTLGQGGTLQFSNQDIAFYVEDSFKPMNNLTLNLGLRYDLQTMPQPTTPNALVPGSSFIHTDKNNFAPRIGLSWDPFKKQKTVIRAGIGMFYGRTQNGTLSSLLRENGERIKTYQFLPSTAGSPAFPNVFSAVPAGASGRPDGFFMSRDFVNPLIYEAELSVEQELFRNFTLSATFMSTRGQKMPLFRDVNLFPPSQTATYVVCAAPRVGSATTCPQVEQTITVPFFPGPSTNRPVPALNRITIAESVVNTWYNGVFIQAKHRFSHGFQMQAALTISKAQDNNQLSQTFFSANQPTNPFDNRNDYSLSNFDQRKRFTMSAVWMPPFQRIGSRPLRTAFNGFQLSTIVSLADGRPYSGVLSGNPTPSGVSTGILGVGGFARAVWVGRNIYVAPGLATTDLRLARAFRLHERARLELIAEAFNLFNRNNITRINNTQYNVAGSVLFPNTAFASVSETGSNLVRERQLQLGARFTF